MGHISDYELAENIVYLVRKGNIPTDELAKVHVILTEVATV